MLFPQPVQPVAVPIAFSAQNRQAEARLTRPRPSLQSQPA
jgi:hypothetical protein